jgi:hypothetical protein
VKPVIWTFFAALVAYNAVDAWQTHLLLQAGAVEVNPLFAWLGKHYCTVSAIVTVKSGLLIILAGVLYLWLHG